MSNCTECGVSIGGAFGDPICPEDNTVCKKCGELRTSPEYLQEKEAEQAEQVRSQEIKNMPVSTTDSIPGKKIEQYVGLVRGGTVRAKHVGSDLLAGVKNVVGGEIKGYSQLLSDAREEAIFRMREDATSIGANAVIGMNFSTSMIDVGTAEVTAFGTAVLLESD